MIGYHAVSVIADAMAKGIKGFDYEKAYQAAKGSANLDHFGLAAYKKRGYISMEDENESVSRTLEYAYNDWCIAQMAKKLGKTADAEKFAARSQSFENLFDPSTGFMRPKKNGGFVEPFAPNEVTFGFTEGNSWQYSFFVPQDVTRLIELQGGREKFISKLDELFTTDQKLAGREQADLTGLIGQYAHGNEPSHHIAYLYNYAGQPWKTQKYVRQILDEFYKPTPDGLIGNEDCRQMSAWYVLSASGFYPVTPGSTTYVFGTPLFPSVTFNLENGKTFVIKAPKVSAQNIYINYARLNGQPRYESYLEHSDLMRGGVLEFDMTNLPSVSFTKSPITVTTENPQNNTDTFVAVPQIEGARVFRGQTSVTLRSTTPNVVMTYTVDNGTAKTYTGPFNIAETSRVEAFATNPKTGAASFKVEAKFIKRPNDWTVRIISPYSTQYTGGGDDAIIDGIRGTTNFASGEWQGYQGKPFEAVIDLGKKTIVSEVGGSFLQVVGPWIWLPDRIRFAASDDGITFTEVHDFRPNFPTQDMKPRVQVFQFGINPIYTRYIRVRADNFGKIPSWHPGAGGDPWIFVDEIIIK